MEYQNCLLEGRGTKQFMVRVYSRFLVVAIEIFLAQGHLAQAQENSNIRVVVNMVQLNVAVTDKNGNYVTGLRPQDFAVAEDGISEKIANFAEGSLVARSLGKQAESDSSLVAPEANAPIVSTPTFNSLLSDANVFVLFDTSNYMYRGFVFAQDAITSFVRSLDSADKIAFYSYSRNLSRVAPLTSDRALVLRAIRSTVAGDEAALYNALLLTLKDAARNKGRKIVVVFSNGPDNFSVVPPEDVAEFAQSQGVSIYMISTQSAKVEPLSTAVFERMATATGGKAYVARDWEDENRAFASIRDDLAHLYSISYYPRPNPNTGWRAIKVELVGNQLKKAKVRTRNGYRTSLRFSGARKTPESGSPPE